MRPVTIPLLLAALASGQDQPPIIYTVSASPYPGFLQMDPGGNSKENVNINVLRIVDIHSDGRGCVIVYDDAGQRRVFFTKLLPQQLAGLLAQARKAP